jgi:hypothetical protein
LLQSALREPDFQHPDGANPHILTTTKIIKKRGMDFGTMLDDAFA